MVPNLHTVAMGAGVLCVHCRACGRRAALDKHRLAIHQGNMTQLRDLTLRCEQCGARGSAPKEFDFYIPQDFDEAKAFVAGEELPTRKVAV